MWDIILPVAPWLQKSSKSQIIHGIIGISIQDIVPKKISPLNSTPSVIKLCLQYHGGVRNDISRKNF